MMGGGAGAMQIRFCLYVTYPLCLKPLQGKGARASGKGGSQHQCDVTGVGARFVEERGEGGGILT